MQHILDIERRAGASTAEQDMLHVTPVSAAPRNISGIQALLGSCSAITWSPRPLTQQSNLSKMQSFSYRSHSCGARRPHVSSRHRERSKKQGVMQACGTCARARMQARGSLTALLHVCRAFTQSMENRFGHQDISIHMMSYPNPYFIQPYRVRTRCRSGSCTGITDSGARSIRTSLRAAALSG